MVPRHLVSPALIIVESSGTTRLSFLDRLRGRSALVWAEFDERYRELLYRYARRRGATHTEAEDIVQEVQLYVFKAMDRFQYDPGRGRFRGYLRTAVIHAMGRRAKNQERQEAAVDPQVLADVVDAEDSSDTEWEREWQLHRLRWALRNVAKEFEPATLQAFRLHVLGDWSADDTAKYLGISRASVYQAKSRVLRRLRERIEATDDVEER